MICYAGGQKSFAAARDTLRELCHLQVSDEYIRQVTQAEGPKIAAFAAGSAEVADEFAAAAGEVEFETDATKVNTTDGWRDVKIGIFAKRPAGESAGVEQWADRDLPKPTARFAFAQIEECGSFGVRWPEVAKRLHVDPLSAALSVLGDGAEWIWNQAALRFPNAQEALDVYHGLEHVSDAAKEFMGKSADAEELAAISERGRSLLLSDGYAGLVEWTGELSVTYPTGNGASLGGMLNYFAGHQDRLNYVLRLRRGQSIGSGMVEGAAKNMIGRRLKANNARWLEGNVNRMAGLVCAMYGGVWESYWTCA